MTDELRFILFSWADVIRAAADYRRKAGRPLPAGTVARRALRQEPELEVDIVINCDKGGESVVTFDSSELSAALIMHCIESGVPLPITHSRKALRIVGKRLALTVAIGAPVEELESLILGGVPA